MNKEKLPIILTTPRPTEDYKPNKPGGDMKPMDGGITSKILKQFMNQFQEIEKTYLNKNEEFPNVPIIGKVIMKDKAIAKSHKPNNLLNDTCPIIGTGKLNELYIKVTQDGIDKMKKTGSFHKILRNCKIN